MKTQILSLNTNTIRGLPWSNRFILLSFKKLSAESSGFNNQSLLAILSSKNGIPLKKQLVQPTTQLHKIFSSSQPLDLVLSKSAFTGTSHFITQNIFSNGLKDWDVIKLILFFPLLKDTKDNWHLFFNSRCMMMY